MVTTDPKTARGIFYKLAKEFAEMDRRNKDPIRKNAISERKPWGVTNDKKMDIPRLLRFKDLEENR